MCKGIYNKKKKKGFNTKGNIIINDLLIDTYLYIYIIYIFNY